MHKHKIKILEVKKSWLGVGEDEAGEVEVGLDLGLEEGHSATCRLGRDPVGYSVEDSDEDSDEECGAVTHTCAHVFLGFQDGGGHTQDIATDFPTQHTVQDTDMDILT